MSRCETSEENGQTGPDDRKATVTQKKRLKGMKNSISESTTRPTKDEEGLQRPQWCPPPSAKNRKTSLQSSQTHHNWTLEDKKTPPRSVESQYRPRHSDGWVRIWRKQHVPILPCVNTSSHRCWCNGGGGYSWHTLGPLISLERPSNVAAYLTQH